MNGKLFGDFGGMNIFQEGEVETGSTLWNNDMLSDRITFMVTGQYYVLGECSDME